MLIKTVSSKACMLLLTSMECIQRMLPPCGYSYGSFPYGEWQGLWGAIPCTSLILHKSLLCIVHPSTLTLPGCGLPKNPTVQVSIRSSHLIWKYVCFQMVCSFLTCLKNMILFFYFGKSDLFTHWVCFTCPVDSHWIHSGKWGVTTFEEVLSTRPDSRRKGNYGLGPDWLPFWSTACPTYFLVLRYRRRRSPIANASGLPPCQ